MYWFSRLDKKERIAINKKDDICFQYAATVALNQKEIEFHPESVWNIKLLINKHSKDWIKFPSKKKIGNDFNKIIMKNLMKKFVKIIFVE